METYHFIVLELTDSHGIIHRGVAYTLQHPHQYVNRLCDNWIKTGKISSNAINNGIVERALNAAFLSWKGIKKQTRLEEHLKYFTIIQKASDLAGVYGYQREILENANADKYRTIARISYLHPVNKWTSEELVYKIIKKQYKSYTVIYQYRPKFLKNPDGGQLSYDVFISELNVAIEYQGKQHFEPVEFFGGAKAFESVQLRDKLKAQLSRENGVKLVYINYWEEITPELIFDKIGFYPNQ